jgi:hypothetical protein
MIGWACSFDDKYIKHVCNDTFWKRANCKIKIIVSKLFTDAAQQQMR